MRPEFIPKEVFRMPMTPHMADKYLRIDNITVGGYIGRCERLGRPIPFKFSNGKRYRILDIVARAKADGLSINPTADKIIITDIDELKIQKEKLKLELKLLQQQIHEVTHILAFDKASIKLTNATLLTEEEIIAGKIGLPSTSGIYFLIKDNEVVYVGQSIAISTRVRTHMQENCKDFNYYAYIECKQEHLNIMESLYIHSLRPSLNGKQVHDKRVPMAPISLHKLLGTTHA
jgi:hypothetical protein